MLNITEFILNGGYKKIGITGNAGSGKSSLSELLQSEIYDLKTYHVDDSFIGDSNFRKVLLEYKSTSWYSYIDACNQYNWWNWDQVIKDVDEMEDVTLIEGAILGPEPIVDQLDVILFVYVPREERFNRLLKRDAHKRDFQEFLARFLITEYSETLYYRWLFNRYNVIPLNHDFKFSSIKKEFMVGDFKYLPIPL